MPVWEEGRWVGLQLAGVGRDNCFRQIIRTAIHNIGHPPPSGVPTLVLWQATQGVCRCCFLFVAWRFVEAGGTHVRLAALVPMCPTVVARGGIFWWPRGGWTARSRRSTRQLLASSRRSHHIHQLLFLAVSAAMEFVSTKLVAVSCCSTMVSLVTASARLLSAVLNQSSAASGSAGSTPCAPPNGSPPPRPKSDVGV
jgi:hypothetical protein